MDCTDINIKYETLWTIKTIQTAKETLDTILINRESELHL